MKKNKELTTYVLMVSETFPSTHKKKGEPTGFINKIAEYKKIHTIRGNYNLWNKRAKKINKGEARLSVRVWCGKPYKSKQREVYAFKSIGVEKIFFDDFLCAYIEGKKIIDTWELSRNDGLLHNDFNEWFKNVKPNEEMAIIHFTDFRYKYILPISDTKTIIKTK